MTIRLTHRPSTITVLDEWTGLAWTGGLILVSTFLLPNKTHTLYMSVVDTLQLLPPLTVIELGTNEKVDNHEYKNEGLGTHWQSAVS